MWWPVALLVISATAFYGLGEALRDAHHAARDREQAARPGGPNPPAVKPCCTFWAASGTVHTAYCRNFKEPAS
ncbi:hypothetical protein ACFYW6_07130 [Streptomyces sp. NPDC002659]|uniref:hypothetical protein n=1 Tax=Streptomyces sp. NPDC002659 TaxID=3364656 RepID=UPI00368CACC3